MVQLFFEIQLEFKRIQQKNSITDTCSEIVDEFHRKPNKIWVDQCSEIYNRSMKLSLYDVNEIIQHSMTENLLFRKDVSGL